MKKAQFMVIGGFVFVLVALNFMLPMAPFTDSVNKNQLGDIIALADRKDVPYGDLSHQKLDIFLPEIPYGQKAPVIVFAHGGGWARGSKENIAPLVRDFTKLGWAVVSINYRLFDENEDTFFRGNVMNEATYDFLTATVWVRSNADKYGFDPEVILAAGASAGGHIAFLAASTPVEEESLYSGVLMMATPLDIVTFAEETDIVDYFPGLLRCEDTTCTAEELERFSPAHRISSVTPPVYILVGDRDPLVSRNQIDFFVTQMNRKNLGIQSVWLDVVPGESHNLDVSPVRTDQLRVFLNEIQDQD